MLTHLTEVNTFLILIRPLEIILLTDLCNRFPVILAPVFNRR